MQDRYLISKALELDPPTQDNPDVLRTAPTILYACVRASSEARWGRVHGSYDLVFIHDTLTGTVWPMDRRGPEMVARMKMEEERRLAPPRPPEQPKVGPRPLDPPLDNPNGTVLFF